MCVFVDLLEGMALQEQPAHQVNPHPYKLYVIMCMMFNSKMEFMFHFSSWSSFFPGLPSGPTGSNGLLIVIYYIYTCKIKLTFLSKTLSHLNLNCNYYSLLKRMYIERINFFLSRDTEFLINPAVQLTPGPWLLEPHSKWWNYHWWRVGVILFCYYCLDQVDIVYYTCGYS